MSADTHIHTHTRVRAHLNLLQLHIYLKHNNFLFAHRTKHRKLQIRSRRRNQVNLKWRNNRRKKCPNLESRALQRNSAHKPYRTAVNPSEDSISSGMTKIDLFHGLYVNIRTIYTTSSLRSRTFSTFYNNTYRFLFEDFQRASISSGFQDFMLTR